jgi:hypothetical protein
MNDLLVWLILGAVFLGVMGITAALGGGYDDEVDREWADWCGDEDEDWSQ